MDTNAHKHLKRLYDFYFSVKNASNLHFLDLIYTSFSCSFSLLFCLKQCKEGLVGDLWIMLYWNYFITLFMEEVFQTSWPCYMWQIRYSFWFWPLECVLSIWPQIRKLLIVRGTIPDISGNEEEKEYCLQGFVVDHCFGNNRLRICCLIKLRKYLIF